MRDTMETTLQQASAFLPAEEDGGASDSFASSLFKGSIDYTPFQDMLRTLQEAVRKRTVCVVRYKAALNRESKEYSFAPMRLAAYHEAMYFVGWIVTDDGDVRLRHKDPSLLLLHRFEEVRPTGRGAKFLPDAREAHAGAFGLMDAELFIAAVRFEASAATYVAERSWSEGQRVARHKDGRITLTFTARSRPEVIAWVLGFGDAAEVLSPPWLRERIAAQAAALAKRYAAGRAAS
jgi:predicted DNA-binding transcriptional regulator YafY